MVIAGFIFIGACLGAAVTMVLMTIKGIKDINYTAKLGVDALHELSRMDNDEIKKCQEKILHMQDTINKLQMEKAALMIDYGSNGGTIKGLNEKMAKVDSTFLDVNTLPEGKAPIEFGGIEV